MMEKFTEVMLQIIKNSSSKLFRLDENGEQVEYYLIKDIENYLRGEEEYTYYKHLDAFFDKLPKNIWGEEAKKLYVMIDFLSMQKDTELYNERTKGLRTKKGSLLKKDDLKHLNKALPILEKLYKIILGDKIIQKESDIPDDMIDDFPPKYLDGIRAINTLKNTIKGIETGAYDQGFYYEQRKPVKEEIKNYLLALNKTYKAEGSTDIKKFIDSMSEPLQYANLLIGDI